MFRDHNTVLKRAPITQSCGAKSQKNVDLNHWSSLNILQHLHQDIFKPECAKHNPSVHDYNNTSSFVYCIDHIKWQSDAVLVCIPDKHQVHYSHGLQFKCICKNHLCNLVKMCRCLLSIKSQHLLPNLFQNSLLFYA